MMNIKAVAMIELILPSLLAAISIAVAAGALGPFVIWQRMAFFSDTLAHSALLGTALALIAEVTPAYGMIAYGIALALVLVKFSDFFNVSSDTLLAILAQISLAAGLLLISFNGNAVNIESLLFGDILTVSWHNVYQSFGVSLAIIFCLAIFWQPFLSLSINEELAATEGVAVERYKLLLLLLILALVAIAVKLLGVLLIASLLLMPAATAQVFSQTPRQMVLLAPLFAVLGVCAGLSMAVFIDGIAAGPAIVMCQAVIWLGSQVAKRR